MPRTLITGFTPFDGREINGSWIAACALAATDGVDTLEIPVRWGQPGALLTPRCEQDCPEIIISMGEGREGWFDIETVARNTRDERADNDGVKPEGRPVSAEGPEHLRASIDATALLPMLIAAGFPARVSGNAGGFLCEEMLFTLEQLKQRFDTLSTVVFVHLPPYGSKIRFEGRDTICNEALLSVFSETLYESVHAVHKRNSVTVTPA